MYAAYSYETEKAYMLLLVWRCFCRTRTERDLLTGQFGKIYFAKKQATQSSLGSKPGAARFALILILRCIIHRIL
jgi:hypothetical protein